MVKKTIQIQCIYTKKNGEKNSNHRKHIRHIKNST